MATPTRLKKDEARNVGIGSWVAISNFCIIDNSAQIFWFNGRITEIVKQSPELKVKIFFNKDDPDNSVVWTLDYSAYKENGEDISTADILGHVSMFAWTAYSDNPYDSKVYIRDLTLEELKGIVCGLRRRKPYVNLDTASVSDLIAIIDGHPPKRFLETAVNADEKTKKLKTTDNNAALSKNLVSYQEFDRYRRDMQARIQMLEEKLQKLQLHGESAQRKIAQVEKKTQKVVTTAVLARKDNVFSKISLLPNGVDPSKHIYQSMWPGVRDGTNTTFSRGNEGINHNRCVRYMHTTDTTIACRSTSLKTVMNGETYYYNPSKPSKVPFAIMEIDKAMMNALKNKWCMDLSTAHDIWYKYTTCKECSDALTDIKFLDWQGGSRKINKDIANSIWHQCAMCYRGSMFCKMADVVPICEGCYQDLARDGNDQYGDDRTKFMRAVEYRFPWLMFGWNDDNRWSQYFTREASTSFTASLKGPDTLFYVEIQDVGKKVWIVLEEDGKGHADSKYTIDGEYNRINGIIESLLSRGQGDHVFVIRYVPKGTCETPSTCRFDIDKAVRMLVIRGWVCWAIKNHLQRSSIVTSHEAMMLYLFYNHDNRHLAKAREVCTKVRVGESYTFPQDIVDDEDRFDWRYCLTPNEGVLINALSKSVGLIKVAATHAFIHDEDK